MSSTPWQRRALDDSLLAHLTMGRASLLSKLDGLSDYDIRRPCVPTGTNLLGLVKHVGSVEIGYACVPFNLPLPVPLPWHDDDAPVNADMWATSDQSRESIVELVHIGAQATEDLVRTRGLDAQGQVPWWGDRGRVTVRDLLVHLIAEIHRHAGHADICRELLDGAVGLTEAKSNVPQRTAEWWRDHVAEIQRHAETFRDAVEHDKGGPDV